MRVLRRSRCPQNNFMERSLAREVACTGYVQPGVKDGDFIDFTDSNDDAHLKRGKFSGGKLTALMV